MKNWFEVNKHGLAKILERKGKEFALFELIQNGRDEPGVTRVTASLQYQGRNQALLDRVKALAPNRIEVLAVDGRSIREWAQELTEREGVDAVIDTLPPGSPSSAMQNALDALRNGDIPAVAAVISDAVPRFVGRSRNTPAPIKKVRVVENRVLHDFSQVSH